MKNRAHKAIPAATATRGLTPAAMTHRRIAGARDCAVSDRRCVGSDQDGRASRDNHHLRNHPDGHCVSVSRCQLVRIRAKRWAVILGASCLVLSASTYALVFALSHLPERRNFRVFAPGVRPLLFGSILCIPSPWLALSWV